MTEPLTPETLAELRRLAEAANADVVQGATYQRDWPLSSRAVGQFLRALTPDLALALLDAAERDLGVRDPDTLADLMMRRVRGIEAERDALVDKVARVRALADHTEGATHRCNPGNVWECPACWSDRVRAALDGTEGD